MYRKLVTEYNIRPAYANQCTNAKANEVKLDGEVRDGIGRIEDFNLEKNGEDAVAFLRDRHDFEGNVLVVLRNFDSADEEVREGVGTTLKNYYESNFFGRKDPESVVLVTGCENNRLVDYDGTLRGRVNSA